MTQIIADHMEDEYRPLSVGPCLIDPRLHLREWRISIHRQREQAVLGRVLAVESGYDGARALIAGGWQNLLKHIGVAAAHPARALELSLIYIEGMAFSLLILALPFLNPVFAAEITFGYLLIATVFAAWAAIVCKRIDILLSPIPYVFLAYVNAWIFVETFVTEVIMRRKNLVWFKPARIPALRASESSSQRSP
ncbi:hypothetical protein HZC00_04675 [Candidatus Kaiserbacteria bacterium]|nr:hypothetical protein [Candidatus Kaiserbacteria bacterium]